MQKTASTAVLQTLLNAGVLKEQSGTVALTDQFQTQLEDGISPAQYSGPRIDLVVDPETADDERKRQLRTYVATLQTFEVSLSEREIVAAANSILEIIDGTAAEGDDLTVTLDGKRFSTLVEAGDDVLALINKQDCDPCEQVRSKLKTIEDQGELPSGVVMVEVPGPENKHLLHERFDVVGAPTLLFCQNGRVEMRLTGDVHLKQIRSDVNRLYG